jgi:hypothetical protein
MNDTVLSITTCKLTGNMRLKNDSNYNVEVCLVPENNKIKVSPVSIIKKKGSCLIDKDDFDLSKFYFRFAG